MEEHMRLPSLGIRKGFLEEGWVSWRSEGWEGADQAGQEFLVLPSSRASLQSTRTRSPLCLQRTPSRMSPGPLLSKQTVFQLFPWIENPFCPCWMVWDCTNNVKDACEIYLKKYNQKVLGSVFFFQVIFPAMNKVILQFLTWLKKEEEVGVN